MTVTPLGGQVGHGHGAATGDIWRIAGPVVVARGLRRVRLYNVVRVGREALPGEVIRLEGELATIQVYENTSGLRVGEPVLDTGRPLEVELGPGLLGRIFDGTQRPLEVLARAGDDPFGSPLLTRGADLPALDRGHAWTFEARVARGDSVVAGDILGVVAETTALEHRILVPPHVSGVVTDVGSGPRRLEEPVAWIDDLPVTMLSRWPVRDPRPVAARLAASTPLITGQRAIDVLFPIARGGAATIPGGFGTGKTVLQQSLAKWAHADVVVYVGCGERGNELAEVLQEFPQLTDPRTGASLMGRTILIANTSNMPVAAREASIYTGVTVAEYFRDQGYHVALMADSTSRWGEALREVSSRLEEMPAEEGYPAYLSSRLAEFYERAAAVRCAGSEEREGSVTIIGAVSPAGGDFSEPITQHSLRLAGTFWALETSLARARHFPAIDWNRSYTLSDLTSWFEREVAADWEEHRAWASRLLQREAQLLEVVQLVGADTLAPPERVLLRTGRLLREDFLQQSAFDDRDAYCHPPKQVAMLRAIRAADSAMRAAVDRGVPVADAVAAPAITALARMRFWAAAEAEQRATTLVQRLQTELGEPGMTQLYTTDHRTVTYVSGPLLVADHAERVAYDELVDVVTPTGELRRGQVLEVAGDRMVVQVLGGTRGLDVTSTTVRVRARSAQLAVGRDLVGRVLDGMGRSIDGGTPVLPAAQRDLNGHPVNPVARAYPAEFIETGVSAIDGLHTLVRGQKLPVFSGYGLPGLELATRIAHAARVPDSDDGFVVVFAAIGVTEREAAFVRTRFAEGAALERSVVFVNRADEPAAERLICPRAALTAAEYLAFELGLHVLVVLVDMTNYCEALREAAAARDEVPGRRGYPGYMYSDLASLFERAGRIRGRPGTVTQLPVLSMPDDDVTHPIPDITGYITEGQIVLSRELDRRGISPPIDVLPSLSRLMNAGIGAGSTRGDHRGVADQLSTFLGRGQELRRLIAIVGEQALSDDDRRILAFIDDFEHRFVGQSERRRSIEETLDLAWDLLAPFPATELRRITPELIERHHRPSPR